MYSEVVDDFMFKIEKLKSGGTITLEQAAEGIRLSNQTLGKLNRLIDKHGFASLQDEIHFFKEIKILPLSSLVFFNEVRLCKLAMPKMGIKSQLTYLNKKVRKINKFFIQNLEFVNYMEQGHTYLDGQYFARNKNGLPVLTLPEAVYYDQNYFTSHDLLLAKVNGLNEFTDYLKVLIRGIKLNGRELGFRKTVHPLVWTESKTALAELIYALYTSSAINNGEEGIKAITLAFEEVFNVKLDNIYKTYSEIKMRKGSKAKFLEELTHSFNHKIRQDDAL